MVQKISKVLIFMSLFISSAVPAFGEDNAVSYYTTKGNDACQVGNYSGAIIWYDMAIKSGYQPNSPIFSSIESTLSRRFSINSVEENNSSNSYHDDILYFQITNPNSMQMKIDNIYIDVVKYYPLDEVWISSVQAISSGSDITRKYLCNIVSKEGSYKCERCIFYPDCISHPQNDHCEMCVLDYEDVYIKLSSDEFENFGVKVHMQIPGAYAIRISLEYSIGSEKNRIYVNDTPVYVLCTDE